MKGKLRQITVLTLHCLVHHFPFPLKVPIFSWKSPNQWHDCVPGKKGRKARSLLEITFLRGRRTKQWSESSELVAGLSQPAPRAASSLCRPGLGLACPAAWDQRESKTLSLPLSSHPAAKGRTGFSSVKGFKADPA